MDLTRDARSDVEAKRRSAVIWLALAIAVSTAIVMTAIAATAGSWKTFGVARVQGWGHWGHPGVSIEATTAPNPDTVRILINGANIDAFDANWDIRCWNQSDPFADVTASGSMNDATLPFEQVITEVDVANYERCHLDVSASVAEDGKMRVLLQAQYSGSVAAHDTTTTTTTEAPEVGRSSSRANPIPVGTTVRLADWEITVIGTRPDSTAAVLAENQFNDPPVEGREFVIIETELTYVGTTSSIVFADTDFSAVGAGGITYGSNSDDWCGVIPDKLNEFTEVFTGGTLSGNLCYSVPTEDIDSLVLIADEGFFGDQRHFMALK